MTTQFRHCPNCAAPLVDRQIEGLTRRACSADCGFIHYDNPTPVVAAVVEHEGTVVLARNRAWPRTFYGLITGFLERNETPAQCVVREVKEELSLDVQGEPTLLGVYAFERMNQLIIGYHVAATGVITLNEELDDYRHVPPERCKVWPAGTGFALRDWLRSKGIEPETIELKAMTRDK
jgi:NAD+ diphosphatase